MGSVDSDEEFRRLCKRVSALQAENANLRVDAERASARVLAEQAARAVLEQRIDEEVRSRSASVLERRDADEQARRTLLEEKLQEAQIDVAAAREHEQHATRIAMDEMWRAKDKARQDAATHRREMGKLEAQRSAALEQVKEASHEQGRKIEEGVQQVAALQNALRGARHATGVAETEARKAQGQVLSGKNELREARERGAQELRFLDKAASEVKRRYQAMRQTATVLGEELGRLRERLEAAEAQVQHQEHMQALQRHDEAQAVAVAMAVATPQTQGVSRKQPASKSKQPGANFKDFVRVQAANRQLKSKMGKLERRIVALLPPEQILPAPQPHEPAHEPGPATESVAFPHAHRVLLSS